MFNRGGGRDDGAFEMRRDGPLLKFGAIAAGVLLVLVVLGVFLLRVTRIEAGDVRGGRYLRREKGGVPAQGAADDRTENDAGGSGSAAVRLHRRPARAGGDRDGHHGEGAGDPAGGARPERIGNDASRSRRKSRRDRKRSPVAGHAPTTPSRTQPHPAEFAYAAGAGGAADRKP